MKIVIFGLAVSSSWGNGHATLWRGLCGALAGHGHRVVFFEKDVPYYQRHRDLERPRGWTLRLYRDLDQVRAQAGQELDDADVAMVTSYCPDGVAVTELVLSSPAPLRCFYDMDTPVTLERLARGQQVDYIGPHGLSGFDLVLSYTGGPSLDELRTRLGARRALPLYGSVDPAMYPPMAGGRRYAASYLGTHAPDRQATLEALFFEPARRSPERDFVLGGALYPDDIDWPRNMYYISHVPPPEHPSFYGSAGVTVNVTRGAMAAIGYCPQGRLFEAAACATPVLSDDWPGLDQFFEPGREILVARSTGEALDVMDMIDRAPDELARVGQRARERVLAEHTAEVRARELVAMLAASPARDSTRFEDR